MEVMVRSANGLELQVLECWWVRSRTCSGI